MVTADYVFGFDLHREANLVFPGNVTHCAVHVRQDVFEACAETIDRLDLNTQFVASNHVYVSESIPSLRAYLQQLYELLRQQSLLLSKPNFQQLILRDFLPLLISAFPLQHERLKHSLKAFRRSRLVKQANDYMQTQIDQPLTLRIRVTKRSQKLPLSLAFIIWDILRKIISRCSANCLQLH